MSIKNKINAWLGRPDVVTLKIEDMDENFLRDRINRALRSILTEEYVTGSAQMRINIENALYKQSLNLNRQAVDEVIRFIKTEEFIDILVAKINNKQLK